MNDNLVDCVRKNDFLNVNEPVVLALSGGIDSMVLLDVLLRAGFKVVIAHVNHGKRPESEDEYTALKRFAEEKRLPFEYHKITEPISGNFQAEARKIRYRHYSETAKKHGVKTVVTAHHQDDQVETFLMRLIDNHDLLSLKGMNETTLWNDLTLVRPFLSIKKETITAYAKEHDITYFEDSSNLENSYTRNKIRNRLMPELQTLNANISDTIQEHIDTIKKIDDMIGQEVETFNQKHPDSIPIASFLNLNETLQKQILLSRMAPYLETPYLSKGQHKELIKSLEGTSNFVLPLREDVELHREYDRFFINKTAPKKSICIRVHSTGTYDVNSEMKFIITTEKISLNTSKYIELWYNDEVFPIDIRNRAKGDYIEFNFGRKKLKDLLIDMKIPPHERDRLIVVAKGQKILWIPSLDVQSFTATGQNKLYMYIIDKPASSD